MVAFVKPLSGNTLSLMGYILSLVNKESLNFDLRTGTLTRLHLFFILSLRFSDLEGNISYLSRQFSLRVMYALSLSFLSTSHDVQL